MEEASLGKITKKFTLRTLLWFIVIDIVVGGIVLFAKASGFASVDSNDATEMGEALNGLIKALIFVNIIAALVSVFLANRTITTKFTINAENCKAVFKNVTIVIIVFAVVMGILHLVIKNSIFSMATEDSDLSMDEIKEARKDIDEYVEEENLSKSDKEVLEVFDSFMGLANVYVFDCIAFLVMIPVEYYFLVKKNS